MIWATGKLSVAWYLQHLFPHGNERTNNWIEMCCDRITRAKKNCQTTIHYSLDVYQLPQLYSLNERDRNLVYWPLTRTRPSLLPLWWWFMKHFRPKRKFFSPSLWAKKSNFKNRWDFDSPVAFIASKAKLCMFGDSLMGPSTHLIKSVMRKSLNKIRSNIRKIYFRCALTRRSDDKLIKFNSDSAWMTLTPNGGRYLMMRFLWILVNIQTSRAAEFELQTWGQLRVIVVVSSHVSHTHHHLHQQQHQCHWVRCACVRARHRRT